MLTKTWKSFICFISLLLRCSHFVNVGKQMYKSDREYSGRVFASCKYTISSIYTCLSLLFQFQSFSWPVELFYTLTRVLDFDCFSFKND